MKIKTPNPEIFLEAAQVINDYSCFSCHCVSFIVRKWYGQSISFKNNSARKWYENLFEIDKNFGRLFSGQEERVLALLFAYHIAMDERGEFEMPVDETEEKINQIVKIGAELGLNCVILKNFVQSQIDVNNSDDDEVARGHNPQKLTNKQVGVKDGWRLLSKKEISFRNENGFLVKTSFLIEKFIDNTWVKGCFGDCFSLSYRTKMPKKFFLKNVN